jgi:hypothetical protein
VATIEIGADVGLCWTLLADPRLVPEWVPAVAQVDVLERDAHDRAVRVSFVGMPSSGSLEYELDYRYDEGERRVSWTTAGALEREPERQIIGEARLEDLGGGRCRLHNALAAKTGRGQPSWARDTLADDNAEKVARAFQRFAEGRAVISSGSRAS